MLQHLHLHQIGPAPDLQADFGSRLNVITGDNGLGKTFLLDACWYALTHTWADSKPFYPRPDATAKDAPQINFRYSEAGDAPMKGRFEFNFQKQNWSRTGNPFYEFVTEPALVLYARIDGGFSVWDTLRSSPKDVFKNYPAKFDFSRDAIWNGLRQTEWGAEWVYCNGLLRDVETWRLKGNGAFDRLQRVLAALSPAMDSELAIGESVRVGLDVQDIPTLRMPYGPVPVTQAASGIRRVLALAYLIVWAWEEHRRAAEQKQIPPTGRLVLLFDEVEAHLHPKWQRVFLPSLLTVTEDLIRNLPQSTIQIIATTHAPLVLSSVETHWDHERDRLFDLDLIGEKVYLEEIPFEKHGSAEHWLGSDSFDLPSSYSKEAQAAIAKADAFMIAHPDLSTNLRAEAMQIDQELKRTLGNDDEYWPYWAAYFELPESNQK